MPDTLSDGSAWPKVSVITPAFNQAEFIEETIRSVLLQGYPNLEYIVIDGGSTDGTVDIVRRYQPWLADWVSEPDRGQSDALNKGLRRSTGEIIGWLNSDDTYCAGAVADAGQSLAAHAELAAVYSDSNLIDEYGKIKFSLTADKFSLRRVLFGGCIPQPTVFLRRAILERMGGWDCDLHFVMDYDLWTKLGLRECVVRHLPRRWANFRLHARSKSMSQSVKLWDELVLVLERVLADRDLPRSLAEMRTKIMGFAYLRAACNFYAEKLVPEAQVALLRAIELDQEILRDYDQLLLVLLRNVMPDEDPIPYFQFFFEHLPSSATCLARLRRRALSDVWVPRAFQAYWSRDYRAVRKLVPKAIVHRPTWLRNRGLLSIYVRSLLRSR